MPERQYLISRALRKRLRAGGICAVEARDVEWNSALDRQA
jgi:hypothetical protein